MRRLDTLRSEHGFTLAELLVACAVIAFLMPGLLIMLQSGQRSYLVGSNQIEAQQSVRVAIERMVQEIRSAGYCPTCAGAPPFPAITAQSATGFTLQNDWNGSGTITTVGTVTDASGNVRGEQVLYALVGTDLTRREIGVDAAALTLASGISSLAFTYQDSAGVVTVTPANIRTIVIAATTRPQFQPAASNQGRVQVTMTDSARLRNR
jgi:prepilin-type N-terminal cleavage/methylation domain-containing protein